MALPQRAGRPAPFTVVEYFADPAIIGVPRSPAPCGQPGVRRAGRRRLPAVAGGARPGLAQLRRGGRDREVRGRDDGRPRPPDPPRPSHVGELPEWGGVPRPTGGPAVLVGRGGDAGGRHHPPCRSRAAHRSRRPEDDLLRGAPPRRRRPHRTGRTIERVESHGKRLEMEWDDGRHPAYAHADEVARGTSIGPGRAWQRNRPARCGRGWSRVRGLGGCVLQLPRSVETYRRPDASRHPVLRGHRPRPVPRRDADLRRGLASTPCSLTTARPRSPSSSSTSGCSAVFSNVYRCEVLWVGELTLARVADLTEAEAIRIVDLAAELLQANLVHAHGSPSPACVAASASR